MNSLYEARNGRTGESYERCYIWAPNAAIAEREALRVFRRDIGEESYLESLKLLFSAGALPY